MARPIEGLIVGLTDILSIDSLTEWMKSNALGLAGYGFTKR